MTTDQKVTLCQHILMAIAIATSVGVGTWLGVSMALVKHGI